MTRDRPMCCEHTCFAKAGWVSIRKVLSASDKDALALIRLDRLKEAVEAGLGLLTEAGPIHVRKPGWARFEVALAKGDA